MSDRKTGNRVAWGRLLLGGLVLLGLAGCTAPNALQQDYGRSVHNNIAQQIANPKAGLEPSPTVGLDPKAGQNELERYDKSFKSEEKKALEMKAITSQ